VRLVVLGDPVGHSLSPAIHRAGFVAAGIEGTYEPRRVDAHGMVGAVGDIRAGELDGANVTMPHKHLALALSDRAEHTAQRAGAANTLVGDGSEVVAYNTDIIGIRAAWAEAGLPQDTPVLIVGAGGAAAAALLALEGRDVAVTARNEAAAKQLVQRCDVAADVVAWASGLDGAVVVNATPVGMQGEDLPRAVAAGSVGVFDMAYGAGVTPLVAAARAAELPTVDGETMLLAQAAGSFELWTGVTPDRAAMRRGLEAERADRELS
jgi:shikimate dehydrogenase